MSTFQSTCFFCEVFVKVKNYLKCPVLTFSCLEEMFPPQSFVKNEKIEGGHMDQNWDPIVRQINSFLAELRIEVKPNPQLFILYLGER